jgi:hypothetical protein
LRGLPCGIGRGAKQLPSRHTPGCCADDFLIGEKDAEATGSGEVLHGSVGLTSIGFEWERGIAKRIMESGWKAEGWAGGSRNPEGHCRKHKYREPGAAGEAD